MADVVIGFDDTKAAGGSVEQAWAELDESITQVCGMIRGGQIKGEIHVRLVVPDMLHANVARFITGLRSHVNANNITLVNATYPERLQPGISYRLPNGCYVQLMPELSYNNAPVSTAAPGTN